MMDQYYSDKFTNSEKYTVAVAVSGGCDSLYALASLAEAGHRVFALHGRFLPDHLLPRGYEDAVERLRAVCDRIGVPLHVIDCREAFSDKVILPFVRAYACGDTPNPCAHCNPGMKFGLLLEAAEHLGADRLATGHYATLKQADTEPMLLSGADETKDQSYFLSLVPREALSKVMFPLASKTKPEIRAWLTERDLPVPIPAESQEICFVPGDDYRSFLRAEAQRLGVRLPGPGPMLTLEGERLGTHKGLWNYTEGQRRGLGIAWKEPLYVHSKNRESNALVVSPAENQKWQEFFCRELNCIVPFANWPDEILVRTRYRQSARSATVRKTDQGYVFSERQTGGPYTCGQLVTCYSVAESNQAALRVLGGGIIKFGSS